MTRLSDTDDRFEARHPIAPNVLERDFKATAPNQKWLADLTYVPTAEGWLYRALVLDLFARKIGGWATSPTIPQELTLAALQVALGWRDPDADLLHHSDRSSQYAANDYRDVLKARGITVSMSRKGNCGESLPHEVLWVQCTDGIGQRHAQGGMCQRGAFQDPKSGATCAHRDHWRLQHGAQVLVLGIRAAGTIRAALARRRQATAQSTIAMSTTALTTVSRFLVRRKRPNRPSVDNAFDSSWCPHLGGQFK